MTPLGPLPGAPPEGELPASPTSSPGSLVPSRSPPESNSILVLSPGVRVSVLMVRPTYRPAPAPPHPTPGRPHSPRSRVLQPGLPGIQRSAGRSWTAGRAASPLTLCGHPAHRSRRLRLAPNRPKCEEQSPLILFRVLLFPCGQNFNLYLLFNSLFKVTALIIKKN